MGGTTQGRPPRLAAPAGARRCHFHAVVAARGTASVHPRVPTRALPLCEEYRMWGTPRGAPLPRGAPHGPRVPPQGWWTPRAPRRTPRGAAATAATRRRHPPPTSPRLPAVPARQRPARRRAAAGRGAGLAGGWRRRGHGSRTAPAGRQPGETRPGVMHRPAAHQAAPSSAVLSCFCFARGARHGGHAIGWRICGAKGVEGVAGCHSRAPRVARRGGARPIRWQQQPPWISHDPAHALLRWPAA